MAPTETILLERDGPVLKVTLNRPEARNALSPAMVSELADAFELARGDAQVRVVVLMGSGAGAVEEVVAEARDAHAREVDVMPVTLKDIFLDAATPYREDARHASL